MHLDFSAPLPLTHPPPSVPGHLVWGSLRCGTAADYVIISGPFWSLAVCVCETNEAFQRDACQNDHNLHQSCRCVKAPPPTPHAKLSVQSAVCYFSFLLLPSGPFTCPCITSSSIHPSIFPFCLLTLSFIVCSPSHPHPPSSYPPILPLPPPLLSSSPDVLLLSSRLPRFFLSLLPPACSVAQIWADFLTSGGPVTALRDPLFHLDSFLSACVQHIILGNEFLSLQTRAEQGLPAALCSWFVYRLQSYLNHQFLWRKWATESEERSCQ